MTQTGGAKLALGSLARDGERVGVELEWVEAVGDAVGVGEVDERLLGDEQVHGARVTWQQCTGGSRGSGPPRAYEGDREYCQ